ncbi:energy transducer TonB [Desulfobulbus oligotrophicus]|uniref:TonB family protein n=1 Tax=Desulfobulbus oligotrophicus TaxID=1909699 RepID=A0A7T5VDG4_9BACT|nr:energy transducer TonB [Desulfobulbus oligotrophicus]QQG65884.1 TonB family protein [Desulfobulbus oligotrophicus]
MNRQAGATTFSVLLHAVLLWSAVSLGQQSQIMRVPVPLDFSILAAGPVETVEPAAPPKVESTPPTPAVKKKTVPKPVAKKKPQQQVKPKKTIQPVPEKTQAVEIVPVAAAETTESRETPSTAETAAPAAPANQPKTTEPRRGGGGGGVFSVSQLDGPLAVLAKASPIYPPAAKRRNIQGWIKVRFLVDERGKVGRIAVLSADPQGVFEESVLRCISNWRFKPGTVKGVAVKAMVEQTITFKLEG